MSSRLLHQEATNITPSSVLEAPFNEHSTPEYTGNSMTPPNSPSSSQKPKPEPLTSPWIESCSERAEVFTQSRTLPGSHMSTSGNVPNPETTTVLLQQSRNTPGMKRSSTKASLDITTLPFPSSRTLPAPTGFTDYMKTMKSESQQHGPVTLPPARQMVRKRREFLMVQALKDSILNFSRTNLTLRAFIAEEVRKGVESTLTGIEKDPVQIVMTVGSHGKGYWSKVHQEYHSRADWKTQPLYQIYSKKDIERILFFWAIHQSTLPYGEIACRLHLPVGALLSWILGFIDHVQDI